LPVFAISWVWRSRSAASRRRRNHNNFA
jgi:hypothetical protein